MLRDSSLRRRRSRWREDPDPMESVSNLVDVMLVFACDYPGYRTVKIQGNVVKMSQTPGDAFVPAPRLGQHNKEVFGLSDAELAALREAGAM